MNIESKRLLLRRFKESDADDLFEYLSDGDVVRYEPYDAYTYEQACSEARERAGDECFVAVCLRESGKVIGNLYYCRTEPGFINTYELGYVFNSEFQGQGYATEAAVCLMGYIFDELDAHRIVAFCNPGNIPSWRLLERLGFRREAELKKNMFFSKDADGSPIWFDSYQYAMLEEEYAAASYR